MIHFGDRLTSAIREKKAPVCVGLDPLIERLPESFRAAPDCALPGAAPRAFLDFGRGVIDAVAALVPAMKINIAFFEPYGPNGIETYLQLIGAAHEAGLLVIADVKRADIGHTSAQYARATLDGSSPDVADAVTVNPYFGSDGVASFVDLAKMQGRGVFVLVQTSNKSAAQVQGLTLEGGETVCQHVAGLVERWATAEGLVGTSGYSCVGAVVSPRDLESTIRIRELMPHCIFLVPGFGAQGRTAAEVAQCFKADGMGAIVAASRSVIFAHDEPKFRGSGLDWKACVREACAEFVNAVRSAVRS